ncbi:MAG: glutamate racemase [Burkholderiaceae bacterium]|nr:glutamate racemase [Burkholderiaceae bacterium]
MADPALPVSAEAPIGVFDSGIGGLSVLRHVHALLPSEELLYFADSGFAPYGEKPEHIVVERALAITAFLLRFKIKAIVVACNTATAAAIAALRKRHPLLQVVGVEPGLKPAAQLTQTGKVGVLATAGTLASDKFLKLRQQVAETAQVEFHLQACNGLADQIEKGELASRETRQMVRRYVAPLVGQAVDTLVLGCTHYPFVEPLVREAAGPDVRLVDTGEPVARQLQRLLSQHALLRPEAAGAGSVSAYTTGSRSALANAFRRLLELDPTVEVVAVE